MKSVISSLPLLRTEKRRQTDLKRPLLGPGPIPLGDYVANGVMIVLRVSVIRRAIEDRLNIVIAGGTGSGKTTLANTVIAEIAQRTPSHRPLILEDTAEIQCVADNTGSALRRLEQLSAEIKPSTDARGCRRGR